MRKYIDIITEANDMTDLENQGGIHLGGSSLFAVFGVVDQEYKNFHWYVPMERISAHGSHMSNPLFNVDAGRIVPKELDLEGPTLVDVENSCVRFMFSKDARKFYNAMKRVNYTPPKPTAVTPEGKTITFKDNAEWASYMTATYPEKMEKLYQFSQNMRKVKSPEELEQLRNKVRKGQR